MKSISTHPAAQWQLAAKQAEKTAPTRLRLAAMAGHMQIDKIAARRAALIDLLADGRPHTREEIWETVASQLDADCWGKVPQEALARDLAALRQGGIRIAYARRPEIAGYYLQYPRLERPSSPPYEATNWQLIEAVGELSVPEKNKRTFAAADFALQQKKLLLAETHPGWPDADVEQAARRLVFGENEVA
ncbi:hypothetical protein [Candidatus Leptofilum sp.]|uniref:hypothetical protein n=1 Tax=Candidatus Leptofilum sp. TaxID=3241576 RepID=UPI003B5C4E19